MSWNRPYPCRDNPASRPLIKIKAKFKSKLIYRRNLPENSNALLEGRDARISPDLICRIPHGFRKNTDNPHRRNPMSSAKTRAKSLLFFSEEQNQIKYPVFYGKTSGIATFRIRGTSALVFKAKRSGLWADRAITGSI